MIACKHEIPEPLLVIDPPTVSEFQCSDDSIYFNEQVLPIFASSCAVPGCHDQLNAQEGFVFDSYENIMASGEITPGDLDDGDIVEVINEDDPDKIMPPPPNNSLSQEQIDIIEAWILQGAVNNSCPDAFCDTLDVSYSTRIEPLILSNCSGCHDSVDPTAGLSLTSYDQISEIALSGSLQSSLLGMNGFTLMPFNGNELSDCQIRMIELWIDNGAPND